MTHPADTASKIEKGKIRPSDAPIEERLDRIEKACAQLGIKPSTLGICAMNNSKLFDRLRARLEKTRQQLAQCEAHIEERLKTQAAMVGK